jgi:hypothetical protein
MLGDKSRSVGASPDRPGARQGLSQLEAHGV